MKNPLLLLEDVVGLGRQGEVVTAKPGFVRNFLLPQKKAVIADKNTLKMQKRLQEEREKQAAIDRKEAEAQAAKLVDLVLSTEVKVDPEGKVYGSVTALDIARLLQEKGYQMEKRSVVLAHPIKSLGTHTIRLKLKEGVEGSFSLEILPEGGPLPEKKKKVEETETPEEGGES